MGILQAGILEWIAMPPPGDLSNPGIKSRFPILQADSLPAEPQGKPKKKAECQRIDAFELRCWRRLLRVHWTARRFNQSILKEISPGCSLEELMVKLKLQYFGHLLRRTDSLEKTLMLGRDWGQEEKGNNRG